MYVSYIYIYMYECIYLCVCAHMYIYIYTRFEACETRLSRTLQHKRSLLRRYANRYFLANRVVGLPNRARQEATIDANIDPNPSRKRLRGTPNRPEIDPRTLSGRPVAPKSVRRASRECPGSVSGRPRHVPEPPRRSPRPPLGTRKNARERPGAHRGDQN